MLRSVIGLLLFPNGRRTATWEAPEEGASAAVCAAAGCCGPPEEEASAAAAEPTEAVEDRDRDRVIARLIAENAHLREELARAEASAPQRAGQWPPLPLLTLEQDDIRKTLATNLRIRAAEVDVNQRQTAERANISERHLSKIMNCKASPTIDVIEALARALNTSTAALLTPRYL